LIKEKEEEERYQKLKRKIENGGEYVNYILEIKELNSEEKRIELQELLERKWHEQEEHTLEEERLNK
jgi:hypothetical protein